MLKIMFVFSMKILEALPKNFILVPKYTLFFKEILKR